MRFFLQINIYRKVKALFLHHSLVLVKSVHMIFVISPPEFFMQITDSGGLTEIGNFKFSVF